MTASTGQADPQETVEYFVLLTVQGIQDGGLRTLTLTATPSLPAGAKRTDLYEWMIAGVPAEAAGLPVIFFSAELNRIGGAA
jgi:hypothetical protein